jgi:hemerythrin
MSKKGFIVGTVDKRTNKDFSISPNPHIHDTQHEAITEAQRLLSTRAIHKDRKAVVLAITSFVSYTEDPFIIE